MAIDLDAFEPGSSLWVGEEGAPTPMKLAALFDVESSEDLYGLLWAPDESAKPGYQVYSKDDCKQLIGHLGDPRNVFGDGSIVGGLFHLVVFSTGTAAELRKQTSIAAHSENMVRNAFLPNRMKARIPQSSTDCDRRKGNDSRPRPGRTGYIVGGITNALLKSKDHTTTIEYASLASKGSKRLAEHGDGGLPVLSSTNAIVGFVVGSDPSHTLVVPAERLVNEYRIAFRTFPGGIFSRCTKVRTKPEVRTRYVRRPRERSDSNS